MGTRRLHLFCAHAFPVTHFRLFLDCFLYSCVPSCRTLYLLLVALFKPSATLGLTFGAYSRLLFCRCLLALVYSLLLYAVVVLYKLHCGLFGLLFVYLVPRARHCCADFSLFFCLRAGRVWHCWRSVMSVLRARFQHLPTALQRPYAACIPKPTLRGRNTTLPAL